MVLIQLDPPLPMVTPYGRGIAVFLRDYGLEHDDYWTVIQTDHPHAGELWTWPNRDVRAEANVTIGREQAQAPKREGSSWVSPPSRSGT